MRPWTIYVLLAVPSKPSSHPIWLKVLTHLKFKTISYPSVQNQSARLQ